MIVDLAEGRAENVRVAVQETQGDPADLVQVFPLFFGTNTQNRNRPAFVPRLLHATSRARA